MSAPIKQIREKQKDILFVLVTAVLLAITINLATSYIVSITTNNSILLLLLSVVFLFLAGLLLRRIVFHSSEHIIRINGVIAFNVKDESIHPVKIIGYPFNDSFCSYLSSFINENKAYAKLLLKKDKNIVSADIFNPDNINHHTIVNSVLELIVLHELQLHLNSYFINNEIDSDRIVTLNRDQFSDGVLKNRVIDLISKDMKERSAFKQDYDSKKKKTVEFYRGLDVVFSTGKNNVIYQNISIELPPKSTICRNSDGFLVITNSLFNITIMPRYEGYSTSLPSVFAPLSDKHFDFKQINLKMHISIKKTAFITGKSMEIYGWLDSFIERMHNYVSTDCLKKRLDPDLIKMLKS